MIVTLLGIATVIALLALGLMLLLNKNAEIRTNEKVVPHKLTDSEEQKVINSDLAISTIPLEPQTQTQERGGRIEPGMSTPDELNAMDYPP